MTKRNGFLNVEVNVRRLLEEIPVSSSSSSKPRIEQSEISIGSI
ncbi:hypothetical protein QRD90_12210 [Peribacillus frigoritolerans]|nr:hypothetical protein [Peribacillus frigoritolerans]WJE49881.1 hypothetical protein QRD90_12210 [Peribacillus frigoritolerans]